MFTNRPAMKKEIIAPIPKSETKTTQLESDFFKIRDAVQKNLLLNNDYDASINSNQLRSMIEEGFNQVLDEEKILFNHALREQMLKWVIADIVGYGPIEPLLEDPEITEIMVNGYDEIFIERFGLIEPTSVKFENNVHLMRVIDRIVAPIGRRVDEMSPMVDARLPNGFRINATIPPLSLDGPILTVRKFSTRPYTVQDLL